MIEILFSDSACGSLKMAQRYGEGKYNAGAVSIVSINPNGNKPSEKEMKAARRAAEEKMRREWENAVPMGGSTKDIYGLNFMLSVGDISEDVPGEKRGQALVWLLSVYPRIGADAAKTIMPNGTGALREIANRARCGETVRIWYSNQPDELCGLYWFAYWLQLSDIKNDQVHLVFLPAWETCADGTTVTHTGWGGVKAGDWHRYLSMQKEAPPAFLKECAAHWRRLKEENAPLRAMLNGRLVSAPETLYDGFILREIETEESEFHQARVIGKVIGKQALGVSDAWIAHRMEGMIAAGSLAAVSEAGANDPAYHRMLKKRDAQ